jgi:hypothetical protein
MAPPFYMSTYCGSCVISEIQDTAIFSLVPAILKVLR